MLAALQRFRHPIHLAVIALRHIIAEPFGVTFRQIGGGDARHNETKAVRPLKQCFFERFRLQKSKSA